MIEQVISTWQINNRIHLYLLDAIEEEHLKDIASSKGRNVGEQFGHIHNVRLMWLKEAAPEFMEGVEKLEKEHGFIKALLKDALEKSSFAIENLLEKGMKAGKIKGIKPYPMTFMGYLIAHEAHHRGQIMLCLKQSGHPVSKKVQFGLWEWGVR